ncbi:hypothetical protein RFM68_24925 [Mesorhizobium sp. MSK_1335]|uniref:Thymidylate synthase n=1 Tax=Mesorhizobium montanum TaxID=3072323 RepID=A0ABU4ZQQ8_9HYPH|nr:hypothetical protein [Mesorhizobium sp. MSK_1335]MDX8527748.1 hypothetical protein [Mesorhizobium sp. MSK_1335]
MQLITGQTSPEVWLKAVEYIAKQPSGEDFDVFLHVEQPTALSKADAAVYKAVDSFLTSHGAFGVHTVAETIFPLDEYARRGATGLFGDFPEKLRAIQKARTDGNWGSYSHRILRQRDFEGKTFNPLEDIVEKIVKHGKYRASFELGAGRPFEDEIAIYDAVTDRKRLYGGPCLSHLSIKVHDGRIRFNATYRSHYYIRRLLGNLVGLGRLQYFLAREAKLTLGGLTINSTFARLDSGSGEGSGGHWTKGEALGLIADCQAIYRNSEAAMAS